MGRPKGSGNRTPQQEAFVRKVEKFMRASKPQDYSDSDCLAREVARIMTGGDHKTKAVLVPTLLKYKLGLPIQPIEHSGEIGLAERVARMRQRVIEGKKGH